MTTIKSTSTRDSLTQQTLGARTLPDIAAAQQASRDWIAAHPEDEGMRDGFEQLSHMEDIARERAALPLAQREWYQRHDCLMDQAQSASTLPEITAALSDVGMWLTAWPADETMSATREQLEIMRELLSDTPVDERSLQNRA